MRKSSNPHVKKKILCTLIWSRLWWHQAVLVTCYSHLFFFFFWAILTPLLVHPFAYPHLDLISPIHLILGGSSPNPVFQGLDRASSILVGYLIRASGTLTAKTVIRTEGQTSWLRDASSNSSGMITLRDMLSFHSFVLV